MSVDIGESLMQSWLRHVKGCQFVQTNWKPSRDVEYDIVKAEDMLSAFRSEYDDLFYDTRKKTPREANSLIMETEIDAVGMDSKGNYYLAEIAFHNGGLGYGDNIKKVREKIIRCVLCACSYLGAIKDSYISFSCPNVRSNDIQELINELEKIKNILNKHQMNKIKIQLYLNERFETNILNPVLWASESINDVSEVFVRACKLLMIFDKFGTLKNNIGKSDIKSHIRTKYGYIDLSEISLKPLVDDYVVPIICSEKFRGIEELKKEKFGTSYYFLNTERIKTGGNYRYYPHAHEVNKSVKGKEKELVYVCSEVTNKNYYKIIEWIDSNIEYLKK